MAVGVFSEHLKFLELIFLPRWPSAGKPFGSRGERWLTGISPAVVPVSVAGDTNTLWFGPMARIAAFRTFGILILGIGNRMYTIDMVWFSVRLIYR